MHARRSVTAIAVGTTLLTCLALAPAHSATRKSAPEADYEMPFPCGDTWTGTTRPNHSPSSKAIDWNRADDMGDPVVASAPGVVTTANKKAKGGYGKSVVIDHGNGEDSLYAHLSVVSVSVGQRVDQGMQIGNVGSTGNSTGSHLHFEERKSRKVVAPYLHGKKFAFGTTLTSQNCVDVPTAWAGRKKANPAVYRRAAQATFRIHRDGKPVKVVTFGTATDEPVVGDWDGKKGANPGVFTPATGTFKLRTPAGTSTVKFGAKPDKPIAGDWNGDGRWEVGAWRAGKAKFRMRAANGTVSTVVLGNKDDLPVTGDWDGDGRTDLGVFDSATATFTLRKVDEEGTVWLGRITFGRPGDLPVTGDWDGNGRTDLAVWTPSTGTFTLRKAATPTAAKARALTTIRFGRRR